MSAVTVKSLQERLKMCELAVDLLKTAFDEISGELLELGGGVGKVVDNELTIDDHAALRGKTLAEILKPHKITHLRYDNYVIEAGQMRDTIKVTYPKDMVIKYAWLGGNVHNVTIKTNGEKGRITTFKDDDKCMEVRVVSDDISYLMGKNEDGEYYISMNNDRSIRGGDEFMAMSIGKYEFIMSTEDGEDYVKFNEMYIGNELKMFDGTAPIIYLNNILSLDCHDGRFVDTR